MKRSRLLAVLVGGVFCVAVMSLYRMLELMQGAELQQHGETPAGQVDDVSHDDVITEYNQWNFKIKCHFNTNM